MVQYPPFTEQHWVSHFSFWGLNSPVCQQNMPHVTMDNCLSPYWLLPHSRPQPHTSAQGRGHPRGGTLGSRHWAEEPPASPLTPLWEHSDLLSAQDEFSRNLCLSTLCRATDRTDRGRHKNRTIHACVNVRKRRSRRARELCVCTSHPSCGASRRRFEPAPGTRAEAASTTWTEMVGGSHL